MVEPFYINLGPFDVIKEGDELHLPEGRWIRVDAHALGHTLELLMTAWNIDGARRRITPKTEDKT